MKDNQELTSKELDAHKQRADYNLEQEAIDLIDDTVLLEKHHNLHPFYAGRVKELAEAAFNTSKQLTATAEA